MGKLKSLASQTVVYGASTILGRLLNFALVPAFTYLLQDTTQMGVVNSLYAYIALLNVLCTMGMETTFFFYANKHSQERAMSHAFLILFSVSIAITLSIFFLAPFLDSVQQTGNPNYYRFIAAILLFDALAILPFAKLRFKNKAKRFAGLKFLNIVLNVSFNILFLYGCYAWSQDEMVGHLFDPTDKVFYIFLANMLASLITLLLVVKEYAGISFNFQAEDIHKMLRYSWPLLVVGIAAWINENMDKSVMERLIPGGLEKGRSAVGIYGSAYKLSIAMAIVVQAFKFAAEPFFFSIQKDKDAKNTYALVLKWFVVAECLVFLAVALNIDTIILILEPSFREGKHIVPIVLMAQMFLGVYYNLSVWYKLTEKTYWGMYMSLVGSAVTIVLLFWLVPIMGYTGAAWATFGSFLVMMCISFYVGKRQFPVPYEYKTMALYFGIAVVFWLIFNGAGIVGFWPQTAISSSLLLMFIALVWALEKPRKLFVK